METKYNLKSPAVKRIMREAQELFAPTCEYYAQPLQDNLFEWHFTIRGAVDSPFAAGVYHGRIILPPEYPMKPPNIVMLTPNGRFEVGKKVCLSISGYHPESWQPSWSIRTALMALIGFLPTDGQGAIGALDYSTDERRHLADKSRSWRCAVCGMAADLLLPAVTTEQQDQQTDNSGGTRASAGIRDTAAAGGRSGDFAAATNAAQAAVLDESTDNTTYASSITNNATTETSGGAARRVSGGATTNASTGSLWTSDAVVLVLVVAIAAILCRRLFLLYDESASSPQTLSDVWQHH